MKKFYLMTMGAMFAMSMNAQTKTINVETPGTLEALLGDELYTVSDLKLTGQLNDADALTLRKMAGLQYYYYNGGGKDSQNKTGKGSLEKLDLEDIEFVEGGNDGNGYMNYIGYDGNGNITNNDVYKIDETIDDASDVYRFPRSLFYYSMTLTDVVLPKNKLQRIDNGAFRNCAYLEHVTFPEGSQYTHIGNNAFQDCQSLVSLDFPATVNTICESAVNHCLALESLTFGGKVNIGYYGFNECVSLEQVTIPAESTLHVAAFGGCNSLTDIYLLDEKNVLGTESWGNAQANKNGVTITTCGIFTSWNGYYTFQADEQVTVHVPEAMVSKYKAHNNWKNFNIVAISGTDGISQTTAGTQAQAVATYAVDGRQVSQPVKGINIVKYSDGSVKKVLVK